MKKKQNNQPFNDGYNMQNNDFIGQNDFQNIPQGMPQGMPQNYENQYPMGMNQPFNQGYGPNMGMPNNMNNGKKQKKFNPLFLIIPVVLVLVIVLVLVLKGKGQSDPIVDVTPTPIPTEVVTPQVTEPVVETVTPTEPPVIEKKYAYESDRLGIKFNYDSNLYCKENVEGIFNTIKEVTPEDREEFNIYIDKVPDVLNIVRLTTNDVKNNLSISVSLIPFEIEKETTTIKIDGSSEVTNESLNFLDLTEEELLEKYDTQIRNSLEESGCELLSVDKSVIEGVGEEDNENGEKRLKGIFTKRSYSGPVELTTSTGVVDVIQCTIPVGKNAILVTAATDGTPIEIDKSVLLNEIVSSLVITTEEPIIENIDESVENTENVKE